MGKVRVILDAFGGDNAPLEILKGAAQAVEEQDVHIRLCGNEPELRELAAQSGISLSDMDIVHSESVIPVEAPPAEILKSYDNSSMAVGLKLLAGDEGDAFVTAGSTGAAVMGATMLVGRIKGIKRPAIGTAIPNANPYGCYMLMDAGANAECRPEMLQQFGIMGSAYMRLLMGVDKPRVCLVNIGEEPTKGLELHQRAYQLLKQSPLYFIGNLEARELPVGGCDVAVCDGFTGNIILKLTEGMGKMMNNELKRMLLAGVGTKMAAALLKDHLMGLRAKFDYAEYGGAPLMGIAKPVIKAHGSSDAKAIKNAVRQAKTVHEKQVIQQIQAALAQLK